MRPAAFLGLFTDFGIEASDRSLEVVVTLPADALRHLFNVIGLPVAPSDASVPGLLLAPCRRPVHPETEEQMMANAALAVLQRLAERDPRIVPASLRTELQRLLTTDGATTP